MISLGEMRKVVNSCIPEGGFSVSKMSQKEDGYKGYRVSVTSQKHHLFIPNWGNLGLELLWSKEYQEPDYRYELVFIEKEVALV